MEPKARQSNLLWTEIGDEVVVYDTDRNRAHSLNPTAALVWRQCDGVRTVAEIATAVKSELGSPADEDVVLVALNQLSEANLLEQKTADPDHRRISRRELVHRLGVAGAAVVPLVTSLVVPDPAEAALSITLPRCFPGGSGCKCVDGHCTGRCRSPGFPGFCFDISVGNRIECGCA